MRANGDPRFLINIPHPDSLPRRATCTRALAIVQPAAVTLVSTAELTHVITPPTDHQRTGAGAVCGTNAAPGSQPRLPPGSFQARRRRLPSPAAATTQSLSLPHAVAISTPYHLAVLCWPAASWRATPLPVSRRDTPIAGRRRLRAANTEDAPTNLWNDPARPPISPRPPIRRESVSWWTLTGRRFKNPRRLGWCRGVLFVACFVQQCCQPFLSILPNKFFAPHVAMVSSSSPASRRHQPAGNRRYLAKVNGRDTNGLSSEKQFFAKRISHFILRRLVLFVCPSDFGSTSWKSCSKCLRWFGCLLVGPTGACVDWTFPL